MPADLSLLPPKNSVDKVVRRQLLQIQRDKDALTRKLEMASREIESLNDIIRVLTEKNASKADRLKIARKRHIQMVARLQKERAEKEALIKFIESNLPSNKSFNLYGYMRSFPDLAKYAFLLMFGVACIIGAVNLGKPDGDMANDTGKEPFDNNWQPYKVDSSTYKSFDLNETTQPVGIEKGDKIRMPDEKE